MDAIVAARVPVEIREQGNSVLAGLGATPTQLINAAYRYVLETGELPEARRGPLEGVRNLTEAQGESIRGQLRRMLVSEYDYSEGGSRTFKEAVEAKQKAEYAAHA